MNLFCAFRSHVPATSRYYHSATLHSSPESLLHFLHLSSIHKSLKLIKKCHAQIFLLGFTQNPFLASKLISAYAVCGVPNLSQLIFNSLQEKNMYLWNSLINGYVKNRAYSDVFRLFYLLCYYGVLPDNYTLATMSKVSGEIRDLNAGKVIHGKSLQVGFVLDAVVANSLMSMYNKCGEFKECSKLFDEMPERNVSSWNTVIAAYVGSGDCNFEVKMSDFVKSMQLQGLKPDGFTVSSLLPLCGGDIEKWDYGKELHGYIVRNELYLGLVSHSDLHLACCLIDMYCRSKRVDVGRRVFDQIKCRNVYAWTTIVNGYVQDGALEEAMVLFRKMQFLDGLEPNSVSLISVLPACSSLAGLVLGKQIHGHAIRRDLNYNVSLCNALIDMYSKCGSLGYARKVFEDDSFCRDSISWSSMISGYGLHGRGEEAVSMYNKMLQLGNRPDMITVVGVLSACGRSGLVDEGLHIYQTAINEYGVRPTTEIYACVVDILGRSGHLDQALAFIQKMHMEPGPSIWGALVDASIMHGNSEMQDLAYRFLIQVEPKNPSNYVSLSNLHASSSRWDNVAEMRIMMKESGLRKTPGCSWISVNSTTHYFYASDKQHPCSNTVYEVLDSLVLLMKGAADSYDFEDGCLAIHWLICGC